MMHFPAYARVLVAALLLLLVLASAASAPQWDDARIREAAQAVEVVHIVYMTHLDVGYANFAFEVLQAYFNGFFPASIQLSEQLRQMGGPQQFRWTTHPWLVHEYLRNGTADQVAAFVDAIKRDDIVWHAGPFNLEIETLDASLFDFSMELATALDVQFGKTLKNTLSQKDVPGVTRGAIPVMARRGVKFVHVGANDCTVPPAGPVTSALGVVCNTFLWRDEPSTEEVVLAECNGYAGGGQAPRMMVIVPGMTHALAMLMRPDNSGPPPLSELLEGWNATQATFPNAQLIASTFDNFTNVLWANRDLLPVMTEEMGDTWVYGVQSDPWKVRMYRELVRQRNAAVINGTLDPNDPNVFEFSRLLVKIPEHTWGYSNLVMGDANFTNAHLDESMASGQAAYTTSVASWVEQRDYIGRALDALGEHPFHEAVAQILEDLEPAAPDTSGYVQLSAVQLASTNFSCGNVQFQISAETGALISAYNSLIGYDWASPSNPLGLLAYQTYSPDQFNNFIAVYLEPNTVCNPYFMKPGNWDFPASWTYPSVVTSWAAAPDTSERSTSQSSCDVVVELAVPEIWQTEFGAPQQFYLQYSVEDTDIKVTAQWFNKRPTRLPEALWFSVIPKLPQNGYWYVNKVGSWINMFDVIANGTRWLHGTWEGVQYVTADESKTFFAETLDTHLVIPNNNSLLRFTDPYPFDANNGMHFNLFNNLWNTNYPMWTMSTSDMFRFVLHL